jgi:quercetin dioxygenase-like cupin family protein
MDALLSVPFDPSQFALGMTRDGTFGLIPAADGPPGRIDGFMVGVAAMTHTPPHGGERHPDGEELVYLLTGSVSVHLELQGSQVIHELHPGQAVIVPRGVWHRVVLKEPSRVFYITPGPGGEHRPLPR